MVFNRLRKQGLIVVLDGVLIDLPSPVNISMWWNFGSLLGVVLVIQLLSGVFLAMHYTCDIEMAFASVSHIVRDVNGGWFLRSLHANGASFFFLCIYCHIGRGLYYGSYAYIGTWLSGLSLLFLVMAAAFLGYVLPWGQMSYWGATVITNLFSAFPYFGEDLVLWLWGGYSVNNATLTRFFAFHFMVPFIVAGMAGLHIVMLHGTGSNNPLGVCSMTNKIPFHWYFTIKDVAGFIVMVSGLVCLVMFSPNALGEPDNFIIANPLITPPHIVPEWYFLFAYAILRSIPNKLGGVLGLAGSIVILGAMPFLAPTGAKGMRYYPLSKFLFWCFVLSFFMLTVGGAWPVDDPYIGVSQFFSLCYFFFFVSHVPCRLAQDELMLN